MSLSSGGSAADQKNRADKLLFHLKQRLQWIKTDPVLYCHLAIAYGTRHELQPALSAIDNALSICPTYAEGHFHRGEILELLGRYEDAYAAFMRAALLAPNYKLALARLSDLTRAGGITLPFRSPWPAPNIASKALVRFSRMMLRSEPVIPEPATWTSADEIELRARIAKNPLSPALLLFFSKLLFTSRRFLEANLFAEYCLLIEPRNAEAALIYCEACDKLGDSASGREGLVRALAAGANPTVIAPRLASMSLKLANWVNFGSEVSAAVEALQKDPSVETPFSTMFFLEDPKLQSSVALAYAARFKKIKPLDTTSKAVGSPKKIRIGYISTDFQEHPVAQLIVEVLELHDRSRFHVDGFALWTDDGSPLRKRIARAFDTFTELWGVNDEDAAKVIASKNVDVLLDLNGYTANARPGILCRRPAGAQINYLGFPGTMAAPFIDYAIVDKNAVTPEIAATFSENLIYMPNAYQPNDRRRPIANSNRTREGHGLPTKGTVFCCMNAIQKINPTVFAVWARILNRVPGSVLWLYDGDGLASQSLRREAQLRNVNPDRLIFASRVPSDQHLERYAVADLFLDTWPYNAHTTASEAVWAGCPVITLPGKTFQSRVAASLLRSAHMDHLVARNVKEYEDKAVELALSPTLLSELRTRIAHNNTSTPLFDTPNYLRALEAALTVVADRFRAGVAPTTIYVDQLL